MAACRNGVSRLFVASDFHPVKTLLRRKKPFDDSRRSTHFFKHLSDQKEHNQTDYEYEVSKDPNEWKYVERLLPLKTVPVPTVKSEYPSGWVPMKDEALKLKYFVKRTKNHMLPVYFQKSAPNKKGVEITTKITKIHGDLWSFHDDLHQHLEEIRQEEILSVVQEGNNSIIFKGDHVYFVEQWLLSKGF